MKDMRLTMYIIFLFMSFPLYSQNVWELTHSVYGQHPNNIEVIDSNYVNIFFSTGSNFKYIYNSRDKGKTWELQYATLLYSYDRGMVCIDSNNIFLGFRDYLSWYPFIYHIKDKGNEIDTISIEELKDYGDLAMYNKNIGIITKAYLVPDTSFILVTADRWKTYKKYYKHNDTAQLRYSRPRFKNDSIVTCLVVNSRGDKPGPYFGEFNINTFDYELYPRKIGMGTADMYYLDDNNIFTCGKSNTLNGGSGNDAIAKSTDGGKTWRRVLDLYSDDSKFKRTDHQPPEFGVSSIAFKDSLTGVAVGQFGKILYTYDGGESWIYENKLHDSLGQPNTMKVRYAGSVPIIATYHGQVFRMVEDNLAPKPEDTLTISGRVWEGDKGQAGIPIILGYRVTMSDEDGYYKFTRLPQGKYTVRAVNKFFDRENPKYYYKPFDYTPEQYEIDLTRDTSGIDFNAIDLRTFYRVSGEIITTGGDGLGDILLTVDDSTTTSTADGKFVFPAIEQKRTYELIPRSKEYTFSPWAYSINIEQDLDTLIFIATPISSVSVATPELSNIRISPNPAGDYIDISIDRDDGLLPREVQILDLLGLVVSKSELTDGNNRVDISNLPRGTYFIKVGDKVEKFVKM